METIKSRQVDGIPTSNTWRACLVATTSMHMMRNSKGTHCSWKIAASSVIVLLHGEYSGDQCLEYLPSSHYIQKLVKPISPIWLTLKPPDHLSLSSPFPPQPNPVSPPSALRPPTLIVVGTLYYIATPYLGNSPISTWLRADSPPQYSHVCTICTDSPSQHARPPKLYKPTHILPFTIFPPHRFSISLKFA